MARPRKTSEVTTETAEAPKTELSAGASELAKALAEAIRSTQPPARKTAFTKEHKNPWMPTDGSPRLRLKRKAYHHGMQIGNPTEPYCRLTNEEIALFNKLKPGDYCNGYVKVRRRRDKGIDIDYPVRTSSQRGRLLNEFGIRSFTELLQHVVNEAATPKRDLPDDDD